MANNVGPMGTEDHSEGDGAISVVVEEGVAEGGEAEEVIAGRNAVAMVGTAAMAGHHHLRNLTRLRNNPSRLNHLKILTSLHHLTGRHPTLYRLLQIRNGQQLLHRMFHLRFLTPMARARGKPCHQHLLRRLSTSITKRGTRTRRKPIRTPGKVIPRRRYHNHRRPAIVRRHRYRHGLRLGYLLRLPRLREHTSIRRSSEACSRVRCLQRKLLHQPRTLTGDKVTEAMDRALSKWLAIVPTQQEALCV